MKNKLLKYVLSILVLFTMAVPAAVHAQNAQSCEGLTSPDRMAECIEQAESRNSSPSVGESGDISGSGSDELDKWLNTAMNVLSALIGLAIVGSFILAGIQYTTARDNASQVEAAKDRILTTVLGFFIFLVGYALLQWLIPGGIW